MSSFAKRHGTTVALVAMLAAGGAYVLSTRHAATTAETGERKTNLLPVYRGDDVVAIQVVRDGETFRIFRRDPKAEPGTDGRLFRLDDGKELADQYAVNKALQALEYATFVRELAKGEIDRAKMGLEKPRFTVTLEMGKLTQRLSIGGPAASPEGAVYVEAEGRVLVARKEALAQLDVPKDALRTRTLVPYFSPDLRGLSLVRGTTEVALTKKDPLWLVRGPEGVLVRVNRRELDPILATLADLKAEHFLDDAAARDAQKLAATVMLVLSPKDEKKARGELVLGGDCPEKPGLVVVRRTAPNPVSACAAKPVYDRLVAVEALDIPDRRAFSLREDEIEELKIEEGDKVLELARKDKGFHQRKPTDADLSREQVTGLLRALTQAASASMPEKGTLAKVRATITLTPVVGGETSKDAPVRMGVVEKGKEVGDLKARDEHPPEVVEVGEEKDGKVPIRRKADDLVLVLSKEDARAFGYRSTQLRSTRVVDATMESMRGIALVRPSGRHVLERTESGTWSIAEPKGFAIDLGTLGGIADQLGRLTADAWVADKDDGTFGLGAKSKRGFEITYKDGDKLKTVKIAFGDEGRGGVFGQIVGEEGVFVAPKALLQVVEQTAIDTTTTVPDLPDGSAVKLSKRGGRTIELLASGDQLKLPEKKTDFAEGRLPQLREALRDLKVESTVHLGAAKKDEGLAEPRIEIRVTPPKGGKEFRLAIGAGDSVRGVSVFYARREGTDAVFAIAASRVRVLEALLE